MLIGIAILAAAVGMLIGVAMTHDKGAAYDEGFLAGKTWGLQLGAERPDEIEARIRSLM